MALTADQRAVVELLLAGQSYPDLADLLELEQAEVERRAREALEELAGADPDRNVGLSDYLLGQADPIGRAEAVRHLRQNAADHALAVALLARLAEIAPGADLPRLPPPPGGGRFTGAGADAEAPAPQESRSPLDRIPQRRSRVYAGLAAAAVILVAVVLGVAGVFSSDDSAGSDAPPAAEDGGAEATGEEVARIPLLPAGNGNARGAAIVGLTDDDQAYLDLVIGELEPAPAGRQYVVWFMFGDGRGYPLPPPIEPGNDGSYSNRFAIPQAVTSLVFNRRAGAQAIEVALSSAQQTASRIRNALEEGVPLIRRPGRAVLEGQIPQGQEGQEGG